MTTDGMTRHEIETLTRTRNILRRVLRSSKGSEWTLRDDHKIKMVQLSEPLLEDAGKALASLDEISELMKQRLVRPDA